MAQLLANSTCTAHLNACIVPCHGCFITAATEEIHLSAGKNQIPEACQERILNLWQLLLGF